ncbi:osmotically-inducible protein Y precursor [mine drainage metagenome]|uniref:Osmotically-inducible protein Y n=1 Tax=mine drainage metagenome TaxID=410659 RepID=A0A1J5QNF7_9ZZZZ
MIKHSSRFACSGTIFAGVLLALLSGCNNPQGTNSASAPTTIGTEVDDSVITTRIRSALMSNDNIKSLDIKVKTRKGEAMLSGFADNQSQIDLIVTLVQGIEGVKSVTNQLSLKEGKLSIGNKIDDSVITMQVKSALLADPMMKSLDVSVTTRDGEVQLSGFIDNELQMSHAVDIARGTNGVSSVVNHMSIKK